MKNKRVWLEDQTESNSAIVLTVRSGWVELELKDCSRTISWDFGDVGSKRGKKKIAIVKAMIDTVYDAYHTAPKNKKKKEK